MSINFNFVNPASAPAISRGRTSQYNGILDAVRSDQFGENGIAIPDLTDKQVTGLRLALNKANLRVATRVDKVNNMFYILPKAPKVEASASAPTPKASKASKS